MREKQFYTHLYPLERYEGFCALRDGEREVERHGEDEVVEEGHADEHLLRGQIAPHSQHKDDESHQQDRPGRDEEH